MPTPASEPQTDTAVRWFLQALGARVDAIETALRELEGGQPDSAGAVRRLAAALVSPAMEYRLPALAEAALACSEATDDTTAAMAARLVDELRRQAATVERSVSRVLIVGGDPGQMAEVAHGVATPSRQALHAATQAEALPLLQDRRVVFIVLNLLLPDADGRLLVNRIRDYPLTAATPILLLCPTGHEDLLTEDLRMQTDGQLEADTSPARIAEWIRDRLRRGHENAREARRDPLTGLLNRAGFRESYTRLLAECQDHDEPLAMAYISIDHATRLQRAQGHEAAERLVRHVGALLSDCSRATDVLGRIGPYTFAACYPGEDRFGAVRAVQKVMERAHAARFDNADGTPCSISLSAGISVLAHGCPFERAGMETERYLFQAQAAGGDRVVTGQQQARRVERALVLSADPVVSRVLTHLLEKEGLTVQAMADPVQAVELLEGGARLRLMIVSAELPPGTGFDLVHRLRTIPACNRVPIVMLTREADPQLTLRTLEVGASDTLAMPISPVTFSAQIRRVLARGKPQLRLANRIRRLLLVHESRDMLLTAASAMHQRGGFQVYLAVGADDARRRIEALHPDIVVLPRALAEAPGARLLEHIDRLDGLDRVAVILCAEREDSANLPDELAANICGVLQTPLQPLTLGLQIEQLLELPAMEEHLPDAAAHLNAEIARLTALTRTEPAAADT